MADAFKRYESWELQPKWFVIGLALFAIGMGFLGFVLMRFWRFVEHRADDQSEPRSIVAGKMQPNDGPPLQPQVGHEMTDAQDLVEMRQREGQVFDKLGWAWNESKQRREIPSAVVEAVKNRSSSTQPSGQTSAERGAP